MVENESKRWTNGIKFVQRSLNTVHHIDLKQTPYKTMFGADPKKTLQYLNPYDNLSRIQSEEELNEIFKSDGILMSDDEDSFFDESYS